MTKRPRAGVRVLAQEGTDLSTKRRKRQALSLTVPVLLAAALAGAAVLTGCGSGDKTHADMAADIPNTAVVKVTRRTIANTLQIASEFQPFQEIDVYAKVSGYIQKLYVDWGTHVQQGQLLAVLEIPELEQQIQQDAASVEHAREDLNRAQSAYSVAHITFQRLAQVQKTQPDLVAQQDIDVAQGKDLESAAAVSAAREALLSAQASLDKDKTLFAYARMTAPFNGVVTEMYAYTGALLPAGTSSNIGNSALCHLAQNDLLRLVIPVPERAVPGVRVGQPVSVDVSSIQRTFIGKVIRISDHIDLTTRTMHTEVQVPNQNYEIIPGMYATVDLPLHTALNALVVPVQAVQSVGEGHGRVLVVNGENKIEERNVTLGLETANVVEVLSGVREGELVVFGEQAQYKAGQVVKPTFVSAAGLE
jgi:RND family efflux transporter MFP subunit